MESNDLKFLIDVGVGKKVEAFLTESGFDIKCIRNLNHKMKDSEILKIANDECRIVITMDKDFGELIFNSRQNFFGVLLLRLDDANGEEKVKIIKEIMLKYKNNLKSNFCVYQNSKIRIKNKVN